MRIFNLLRQKFLLEYRATKYLTYALGEIILVVVGILITLQVNNWNEERKLSDLGTLFLLQIGEDLKSNTELLETKLKEELEIRTHMQEILDFVKGRKSLDMDLLTYFLEQARCFDNMQLNTAAFESLKSSDFYLIKNDTLRIHIIELFDSSYKGKLAMINDSGLERYNAINNFYATSFSSEDTLGVVPNSMEDFMKDQQFYNIMSVLPTQLEEVYVSDLS